MYSIPSNPSQSLLASPLCRQVLSAASSALYWLSPLTPHLVLATLSMAALITGTIGSSGAISSLASHCVFSGSNRRFGANSEGIARRARGTVTRPSGFGLTLTSDIDLTPGFDVELRLRRRWYHKLLHCHQLFRVAFNVRV